MEWATEYPPPTRGVVVVWGLLASYPFGGMTWQVLHHLAGFRQLGFDVWYVEDTERPVLDPESLSPTVEYEANLNYLAEYMERIGLADRWIFRPPGQTRSCLGARDYNGLRQLYRKADAVFNVCGAQEFRPEHEVIQRLVYLETDPAATQVAVACGDEEVISELDRYHYLFTYGENIGTADCRVPVTRYTWYPTRPPVYTDWWYSRAAPLAGAALTTITNWKHAGKDVVWNGETWRWSKHHEFLRFVDLPAKSRLPLELAVGAISAEESADLRRRGWRLWPTVSLEDPLKYRQYIQHSLGEFTAAKEQYVRPRTGWFSDRSVCYLAAGRPVITQETGFSRVIPTGEGLLAFSTFAEAEEAIAAVAANYGRHAQAAREIALEYFDARRVLGKIAATLGLL